MKQYSVIQVSSYILLLGLLLGVLPSFSQSLPVGSIQLEEYYRRQQLLGSLDSGVSMMVRPVFPKKSLGAKNIFYPDQSEVRYNLLNAEPEFRSASGALTGEFLPMSLRTQFNSHHPYGWNDGSMIPSNGLQAMLSGGVYLSYGPLSVQFNPELVFAENYTFDEFDRKHYEIIVARYYDFYNQIDLPTRFGTEGYSRVSLGQSSIRLNHKSLSFGLSTENLWWGPGVRNSLLMSNSAPGFAHLTLNTSKPIKTRIGSFEGQVIAGRLEGSGFNPMAQDRTYFWGSLTIPKSNDWRYLSGLVLTYQPKWVPGLFLGMAKSAQMYSKDLKNFGDYLPFGVSTKGIVADKVLNDKDHRKSLFMRWIWPEEHAEIYFEYGRNNAKNGSRDNALRPDASRAYIFGLRKLTPWGNKEGEYLMLGLEVTQLQETQADRLEEAGGWYTNNYIRHGYTHRGEVLGAGIGPGANMQSLDISWVKGMKRIGLQIERYVHNNDLYTYFYRETLDFRRHWTDLSVGFSYDWNFKNLSFNAQLKGIKSLNYQWFMPQDPNQPYMVNGKDVFNVHGQFGLSYRF